MTTGDNFATVVTENNKVFNWGNGSKGHFADGINKDLVEPRVNENFNIIAEKAGLTVKKI